MADTGIIDVNTLLGKAEELEGCELFKEMLEKVLQAVLEAERDEHVGVGRYRRGEGRTDTRSGYKGRSLKTPVGKLQLRMPQTRNGMQTRVLESYSRVDQSVLSMAVQMYAKGVSTRKVEKLLEMTIGAGVSAQTVSNANKRLDAAIEELRSRPLGDTPVLMLDARYDKVRRGNAVRNTALLVAIGIEGDGMRRVLDFSVEEHENKPYWKDLLLRLKRRGIKGVLYTVSDNHEGLKSALGETFVGAVWNRCHTHITRNALDRAPKAWRKEAAALLRDILCAPDEKSARERLARLAREADMKKNGLGDYIEEIMPDGFAVYALPASVRTQLRTTNMLERLNQEIKRRTKVARIFPSTEAYLRLAGTLLVQTDEDWQEAGRRYLDIDLVKEALAVKSAIKAKEAA